MFSVIIRSRMAGGSGTTIITTMVTAITATARSLFRSIPVIENAPVGTAFCGTAAAI